MKKLILLLFLVPICANARYIIAVPGTVCETSPDIVIGTCGVSATCYSCTGFGSGCVDYSSAIVVSVGDIVRVGTTDYICNAGSGFGYYGPVCNSYTVTNYSAWETISTYQIRWETRICNANCICDFGTSTMVETYRCAPNYYGTNYNCTPCPSGGFSSAGATAINYCWCPANTYYQSATNSCVACPEGGSHSQNTIDVSTLDQCYRPNGTVLNKPNGHLTYLGTCFI